MILNKENADQTKELLHTITDICVDFKLQEDIHKKAFDLKLNNHIIDSIPQDGSDIEDILNMFKTNMLDFCTNFSSKNFMGFPDSGNSVAAMVGAIFSELLQQNLINQSFCAPSATFVEIAVIQWLREVVGYATKTIENVWDVGGVITTGGTISNTIAMLLARENHIANTMAEGVKQPNNFKILVPKGIGHYSIKSSQMWIGCGNNIIEVTTNGYKMDINDLKYKLKVYDGEIMAVVVYAGDSRTMTIDNLKEVYSVVKEANSHIWLHVDACHGFSLGFSDELKYKINGIEKFDSISTDPHKVLCTPYTISALLVKEPEKMKTISSFSDLIMQEDYALGQVTPFFGSKNWSSLKLWFLIKNLGKKGIGDIIEKRHSLALYLRNKLLTMPRDFIVLNDVTINSVLFMYINKDLCNVEKLNSFNIKIHDVLLKEGKYHLHQFSIADDNGIIKKDAILYPLRFMCGNPNTKEEGINNLLEYIKIIAGKLEIKNG